MAIAGGNKTTDVVRTLYTGVGNVKILAVNPSKKALEEYYGRTIDNDPVYVSEAEVDGRKVPSVRLSFIIKAEGEKNNGVEFISSHNIFLQKVYKRGSRSGKYQVIDKYGRTAWATPCTNENPDGDFEVVDGKFNPIRVPMYERKDGSGEKFSANIDIDYRPCYIGEEEVTLLLKTYLNIPNIQKYDKDTKTWVDNDDVKPEECEIRLDHIDDYFRGNFKELADAIALQPENSVKILFGVRTTDDNKQYQTTYPQLYLKSNSFDYSKFINEIGDRKANGGLSTTEFEFTDIHKYTVNSSTPAPSDGGSFVSQMEEDAQKTPWEN